MNTAIKVVVILVALGVAVVVLFSVVFPWVEANFITDPTLSGATGP